MTYKTHLSTGLLLSSLVFLLLFDLHLTPIVVVALIIGTIIGSSAPDLDTPSAKIWQKIPAGRPVARALNPLFLGGHRHLSHSFLGLVIFSFLFYLLVKLLSIWAIFLNPWLMTLAFVVGFISHLLADSFTESGIPLLFPIGFQFGIPPNPLKKARIKTGRWFENLVIYPIVNILLLALIYFYLNSHGYLIW